MNDVIREPMTDTVTTVRSTAAPCQKCGRPFRVGDTVLFTRATRIHFACFRRDAHGTPIDGSVDGMSVPAFAGQPPGWRQLDVMHRRLGVGALTLGFFIEMRHRGLIELAVRDVLDDYEACEIIYRVKLPQHLERVARELLAADAFAMLSRPEQ